MAEGLPPGFKLRQGLDGLILGLAIVFVVRVQMFFSSLIDWRIVPEWTYVPIKRLIRSLGQLVQSTIQSFTAPVESGGGGGLGGGSSGVAGGGGAGGAATGGGIDPGVMSSLVGAVGFPVKIFGALDANVIEQLLVLAGFWIAFLVPLWFWGLRPFLFWWRTRDRIEMPKPE